MTDDQEKEILGRIKETTNMDDLKEVDFFIEAVLEDLNLKKAVLKSWTGSTGLKPSWPPTPPPCRFPRSPWPQNGRIRW
jgi:hypothetical protein